jgi:hypothetical protein
MNKLIKSFKKIISLEENKINTQQTEVKFLYRLKPINKVLYINKNILLEIHKKYIALDKSLQNTVLFDSEKISYEALAVEIIDMNKIFDMEEIHCAVEEVSNINSVVKPNIYPNMPLCIFGKLSNRFNKIVLKPFNSKTDYSIHISALSQNFIKKEKTFIENRQIFIIGIVKSIEKNIVIDVGAVLL